MLLQEGVVVVVVPGVEVGVVVDVVPVPVEVLPVAGRVDVASCGLRVTGPHGHQPLLVLAGGVHVVVGGRSLPPEGGGGGRGGEPEGVLEVNRGQLVVGV